LLPCGFLTTCWGYLISSGGFVPGPTRELTTFYRLVGMGQTLCFPRFLHASGVSVPHSLLATLILHSAALSFREVVRPWSVVSTLSGLSDCVAATTMMASSVWKTWKDLRWTRVFRYNHPVVWYWIDNKVIKARTNAVTVNNLNVGFSDTCGYAIA